jgi:hypothetical protein
MGKYEDEKGEQEQDRNDNGHPVHAFPGKFQLFSAERPDTNIGVVSLGSR